MGPTSPASWLVSLRWLSWTGLLLLLTWTVAGLKVKLPLWWALGVIALGFASNGGAHLWLARGRTIGRGGLGGLMLVDTALHTAFFALTGGPFNPFTVLYLVNLVLATVVLSARQQWALAGASVVGFALLFQLERYAPPSLQLPSHQELMRLHLTGMLVAFGLAALAIVAFMQRVQAALAARAGELEAARKLAALTTLAAGAAHELNTPLSTIAVVAKELERAALKGSSSMAVDDVRLVREQVDRCRHILSSLSVRSGLLAGEQPTRFTARAWLEDAVSAAGAPGQVALEAAPCELTGPRQAMTQAVKNLVKNAVEASGPSPVEVSATASERDVVVTVVDRGPGIAAERLAHVGEPFFTTKEPGKGMGLGVFLARTLAEQLGGRLEIHSAAGAGTTVRLVVPRAPGVT